LFRIPHIRIIVALGLEDHRLLAGGKRDILMINWKSPKRRAPEALVRAAENKTMTSLQGRSHGLITALHARAVPSVWKW
jgi:hypothetical protein